jgi:molybdopterin-guanine dinucleotide biosynthesis protein A
MSVRNVSAAILIGGGARRFGGTFKPGLRVGARTILDRQLAVLAAAGIDAVMLVGRTPHELPPAAAARSVPDAVEGHGPLGGLYTALIVATTPIVLAIAGDMPFLEPRLVRRLAELGPEDEAAVPRAADRWHPLCAAYRRSVALRLKQRLDRRALRVSDALQDMRVKEISLTESMGEEAADMLTNVNTPDDHARAERHARIKS